MFKWLKFTWIQWDLQKSMKRNCKIFFGHKNVQWPKRLIAFIPVFQQHQSAPKASSSCTPHRYFLLTTTLQFTFYFSKKSKKSKMQNDLSAKNDFTQFLLKTFKKSLTPVMFCSFWRGQFLKVFENTTSVICSQSNPLILV